MNFKIFTPFLIFIAMLGLVSCGGGDEKSDSPEAALTVTYESAAQEDWEKYCQGLSTDYRNGLIETLESIKKSPPKPKNSQGNGKKIPAPAKVPDEITCPTVMEWLTEQDTSLPENFQELQIDRVIENGDTATIIIKPLETSVKQSKGKKPKVYMIKEDGKWKIKS